MRKVVTEVINKRILVDNVQEGTAVFIAKRNELVGMVKKSHDGYYMFFSEQKNTTGPYKSLISLVKQGSDKYDFFIDIEIN